jgi:flagellar basal-body rod modification protein FlgD
MESTVSTVGIQGTRGQQDGTNQPLRDLDMGEFIKLMITELQNQDPLNPMENGEILTQISQIREIEASERMTQTLNSLRASQDAVLLGQSLASASGLIGKRVTGQVETQTAEGVQVENVTGVVDRISLDSGKPSLHVGEKKFGLDKILDVRP